MKKLMKKVSNNTNTVTAYACLCSASCQCGGNENRVGGAGWNYFQAGTAYINTAK